MSLIKSGWLALVCFCLLSCQKERIRLAFNTQSAEPQTYWIRSQIKIISSADTALPSVLSSRLETRVTSTPLTTYDDGSARYQLTADSVNYASDQRSVEECRHVERFLSQQEFQFKMGPSGEMLDLRMGEFVPDLERTDIDLRRLLVKIQPILPGGPVNRGTTWERQHVFADDSGKKVYVYKWFSVDDIFERDGQRFAVLRMNLKYRVNEETDLTQIASEDFILGSGEVLFNVDEGWIEEGSLEISGRLSVADKAINDSADLRVRQLVSLRRMG